VMFDCSWNSMLCNMRPPRPRRPRGVRHDHCRGRRRQRRPLYFGGTDNSMLLAVIPLLGALDSKRCSMLNCGLLYCALVFALHLHCVALYWALQNAHQRCTVLPVFEVYPTAQNTFCQDTRTRIRLAGGQTYFLTAVWTLKA
jgi:hypothetical protein